MKVIILLIKIIPMHFHKFIYVSDTQFILLAFILQIELFN